MKPTTLQTLFPLLLFVVCLHYVFVATMSSKVSGVVSFTLAVLTLCGAFVVWVFSGFGGDR